MTLAFPIALARARAERHEGYLRCEHLVRAFDRALRLLAAATCARYLEHVRAGGDRIAEADAVMAALVRPSLGQWVTVAREATEALGKRGLVTPAFRAFVRGESARLSRIVELRNAREHAEDESGDAELDHLVTSFLDAIEQLPELQLTAVDAAGVRRSLDGVSPASFGESGPVRVMNDALDLSPFVVGEQPAEGPLEVFLYHGRHRKKGTLVHMASSRGGAETVGTPDAGKELARSFDVLVRPGADPYRTVATRITASPFRKLRAYGYRDAEVFRGREQSVRDVADLIDERALVVLHAPSGTGKTSLLRAGVRPAIDDVFTWIEIEARGDVVALASAAVGRELELRGRAATGELADQIRALAELTGRSVLLVIDPLEELFRGPEADVELRVHELAAVLAALREAPDKCHVLLSIRADYLGQLERLREAGIDEIFTDTIALRPLDSAGARAALIEPLAAAGLRLSGKLAETIVRDLGGEGQAVSAVELAIVGDALFERASELGLLATASPDRPATLEASVYASLGGAGQVLAAYVRSALAAFPADERPDVQKLLTSMLGGAGVRAAPMHFAQIIERARLDGQLAQRLLGALVEARVVQTSSVTGGQALVTFRISHDLVALELFGQLGDADRRALEVRDALEAAARSWHLGGRPRSGFPAAKQLAYYEQAQDVSRVAEDFLVAARRAAVRRRRVERAALVLVAVLLIAASVTAGLAWRANRAQRIALRDALASEALALARVPDRQNDAVVSALRAIALADHEGALSQLDGRLSSALSSAASAAGDGTRFVDLEERPSAPRVGRFSPAGDLVAIGDVGGTVSLFDADTGRLSKVLGTHPGGPVRAVAFSPDGELLASAGEDQVVALWEVRTGARRNTLRGHEQEIAELAFNADGTRLASASLDGTARLWDVATGREQVAARGHGSNVYSVEVSPDGERIVVATEDGIGRVLDRATGRTLLELRGHTEAIVRAHFARDGRIATSSWDGTARIWDGRDGTLLATLTGHTDYVKETVFSPSGAVVATASGDGTVVLWSGASYERVGEPFVHDGAVTAVAFSHDGRQLATSSEDGSVRVFDLATGEAPRQLDHGAEVRDVQFTPGDDQLLTTTRGTVRLWSLATGRVAGVLATAEHGKAMRAKISSDGRWIGVGETTGVRLWDARSLRAVHHWPHEEAANVGFSPDSRELVTGSSDDRVRVFDLATGDQRLDVTPGTGPIHGVAFDGRGQLVTVGDDATIRGWDPATGLAMSAPLRGHDDAEARATLPEEALVMHLAVADHVAVTSEDRTLRARDLRSGRELWEAELVTDMTSAVRMSGDGTLAIVGSDDRTARIIDVATGTLRAELPARGWVTAVDLLDSGRAALVISSENARIWLPDRAPIWTARRVHDFVNPGIGYLAVSSDGARVATVGGDGRLAMHERLSGRRLWQTERPPARGEDPLYVDRNVRDVVFLGDHRLVAAVGGDVAILDAADGRVVAKAAGHTDNVLRVAASRDGTWVASSETTKVLLWRVDGEQLRLVREDSSGGSGRGAVGFSPDGTRLAFGHSTGEITIVETETGETITSLHGHRDFLTHVEFCEDGKQLLSAGSDKTARVWDVDSTASTILRGHTEVVSEAHFFDGCRRVLTTSWDGSAAVWSATSGERLLVHSRLGGSAVNTGAVRGQELVTADGSNVLVTGPLALDAYLEAACAALEGDPRLDEFAARCAEPLAALARRPSWW